MWELYKQRWKENFKEEIGDRSGFGIFLFYAYIFFGNLGILFSIFFALLLAAWLSVFLHVLPAQEAGEIVGIVLIGWLYFMLAFYFTKLGNKFVMRVGEKIEKSILGALHALRVLPVLPLSQYVKFICLDEAAGSFVSSAPFIPPRQRLA